MITRIERLYADAEAHEDGLSGVVMPYGELAPRPGYQLQVMPGSLAGRMSDVLVNLQHDDKQLLGRTGSNVQLTDTQKELLIAMTYPDTQVGRDAKLLVDIEVLTGFSAELHVLDDTWVGGVRRVDEAHLSGIALVARPAMKTAMILGAQDVLEGGLIEFKREELRMRQLSGEMVWGEPSVASLSRRAAVQFEAGSLDISNPITLMLGNDYNSTAANTADNGALAIQATNKGLNWSVRNMPRTENGEKILKMAATGLITGWRVGYVPYKQRQERIKMMGLDMHLTIVEEAMMCDVFLSSDGPGGVGNVRSARRRRRR